MDYYITPNHPDEVRAETSNTFSDHLAPIPVCRSRRTQRAAHQSFTSKSFVEAKHSGAAAWLGTRLARMVKKANCWNRSALDVEGGGGGGGARRLIMMMMMEERSKMGQPAPHTSRARQGQQRPVETLLHTQRCGGNKKKWKESVQHTGTTRCCGAVSRDAKSRSFGVRARCAPELRSTSTKSTPEHHSISALALEVYVGRVRGCGGAITAKAKSSFTLKSRETVPLAAESSSDGLEHSAPRWCGHGLKGTESWANRTGNFTNNFVCNNKKLIIVVDFICQDQPESRKFQLNPIWSSKSLFCGYYLNKKSWQRYDWKSYRVQQFK